MKVRRILRSGALREGLQLATAALLIAIFSAAMQAQTAAAPAPPAQNEPQASASTGQAPKLPTTSERRRANKLYLAASKLFLAGQFEQALADDQQAAKLDPTNIDYPAAAEVARSHAVTALIQAAAKSRLAGDDAGARAALERAMHLDPKNPEVTQHLYELGDTVAQAQPHSLYEQAANRISEEQPLLAAKGTRTFHLHTDQHELIQQVFSAFGVTAMLDESVHGGLVRFDIDDADFATAARALGLVTNTFYVPIDAHRVIVARDTRENRTQFTRQQLETVYLSGATADELTEAGNIARNVFMIEHASPNAGNSSLTLRAAPATLNAFNTSIQGLLEGRNQTVLDVSLYQLANASTRNTGTQLPQSFSGFNLYTEEQSILSSNSSLVQQIISSGLASPGNTLEILGILLASGQVSSSLFSNGVALFGGGLTASALAPGGPATFNFNLNSSESRALDRIQMRLGDGEAGTLKEGTKYPIQTASYSSLSPTLPSIPGLSGAGTSGGLSSLLSGLTSAVPSIPMIQYQDLGLTIKVTSNVLRSGDVALTVDLTIDALSGSSLNGNPILTHEAFSGVVTLKQGQSAEVASELDKSESAAISGTPGLSELPGLNDITDKNVQKNYSTLVLILTPHVVRATQPAGHSPVMVVEKSATSQ
jgi:general secretion pathway protein D